MQSKENAANEFAMPLLRVGGFVLRLGKLISIIVTCLPSSRGSAPERFRMFFERAGGAFLKLGQILAMRQDFLPLEYTDELLDLFSRVPEEGWERMAEVFRLERGERPETFFASITTRPIASASIGQVYRATMKDGRDVAVKIARPEVEVAFENDFILAGFLGEIIGIFTFSKALPIQDVVSEFVSSTRAELDFRNEAHNADLLAKHAAFHNGVVIPKPLLECSGKHVLIMEYLDRILSGETALRELVVGGNDYRNKLRKEGIDLDEVAYLFVIDGVRQYFIDGFFHADPHPGNIFFLPGNKVGFFDFGLVGRASLRRIHNAKILYALAQRDVYGASKHLITYARETFSVELELYRAAGNALDDKYELILSKIEEIMIDNFALDLEAILRPWYDEVDKEVGVVLSRQELRKRSSSIVFAHIVMAAERYDIVLPRETTLFLRTIAISDMVALRLNPRFDMMKAFQRFFHEFPLARLEEMGGEHEKAIKEEGEIVVPTGETYEAMMELKLQNEERLGVAKERLAELVFYYAEQYPEIRALLKG